MAVSLPGLPDKLRALSARLTIDTHIQRDLSDIIDDAVQCADTFSKSFKENSEKLNIQNELVKQAANPKDVNVQALQNVLTKTKTCFIASRMDILELQTKVHSQIENCRGQVKKHEAEQASKKGQVDTKRAEIRRHKETIDRNESDADDFDKAARELSNRADDLKEMEEEKAKKGLLGTIVSVAVGAVFAPLTGGLSLLAGSAAGAIIGGVNIHDAIDCSKRADSCRDSARDKRNSASNLRDDVRRLERSIDTLEREIRRLRERIGVLEEAIRALGDVTSFLRSSVGVSDEVINVIQEMDTTIADTLLKAPTFSIARKSKREELANKHMEKLRESLGHVQDVMKRNRRLALKN